MAMNGSLNDDVNFGGLEIGSPNRNDTDMRASTEGSITMEPSELKPRILLTGRQRSGKTAISRVVFHKMSPNETLFLQSTSKIVKDSINHSSFVRFEVWEFPGQIDLLDANVIDSEAIFGGCNALIYVIDSQDDYSDSLDIMRAVVTRAHSVNPNINFEVFIHKVDGLNDDHKIEIQRDIYQRAYDKLNAAGGTGQVAGSGGSGAQNMQPTNITLSFSLTSIYDHSIFEAFSKVVQKLVPQLATLEQMLSILVSNSGIEKAFLFDVVSKIYIATDSNIVDMQTYELCCDMIDVVIDMSGIYANSVPEEPKNGSSYDSESCSVIKLTNGTVMVLREVNKYLALVCIIREDHYQSRSPLIDYNFVCFRDGIKQVFEARSGRKARQGSMTSSPGNKGLMSPRSGGVGTGPQGTPASQGNGPMMNGHVSPSTDPIV